MCFSAEADLVAGTAILAVGVVGMTRHPSKRALPLALIPVGLGIHTLTESVVWRWLEGTASETAGHAAVFLYLLLAFGMLPWFVPLAIRSLESDARHRTLMGWLAILGAAVSTVLLLAMRAGVTASINGHHIRYDLGISWGGPIEALYVVATCGPMLASSIRWIRIYGYVNLPVVALLGLVMVEGFTSLWCGWAAVTSILIVAGLGRIDRPETNAPTADIRQQRLLSGHHLDETAQ